MLSSALGQKDWNNSYIHKGNNPVALSNQVPKVGSVDSLGEDDLFDEPSSSPRQIPNPQYLQYGFEVKEGFTSKNGFHNNPSINEGGGGTQIKFSSNVPIQAQSNVSYLRNNIEKPIESDDDEYGFDTNTSLPSSSRFAVGSQPIFIPGSLQKGFEHPNLQKRVPATFVPPHEISRASFNPSSVSNFSSRYKSTADKLRTVVFEQTGIITNYGFNETSNTSTYL